MTIIDADTGEIVSRTPAIAEPGTPTTPELLAHQCRTIEVWAETCTSVEELREADHRLAAIAEYVKRTSTKGRAKVEAARRRLEVRIGQLLGPTKVGERHDLQPSSAHEGESLTKDERSQFRRMADHPEIVDAVIDDSDDETPASRRRVLDEINRSTEKALGQKQTPLAEEARRAGRELHKSVDRIGRILADDRLRSNKDTIGEQLRPHLLAMRKVIERALDMLQAQEDQRRIDPNRTGPVNVLVVTSEPVAPLLEQMRTELGADTVDAVVLDLITRSRRSSNLAELERRIRQGAADRQKPAAAPTDEDTSVFVDPPPGLPGPAAPHVDLKALRRRRDSEAAAS